MTSTHALSPPACPIIETMGLGRSFRVGTGTVQALADVDLEIWPGELVALVGASGSGKSTLLTILGCLDQPTTGTYTLAGQPVDDLTPPRLAGARNRQIGFVFQSFNLLDRLRADENVALPMRYAGWSKGRRLERARSILEKVGLEGRMDHTPTQLSGGQCQRVAIARALALDPPLILADEPTGNLDSRTGAEILTLLQELNLEGRTVVLVTHDDDIAARAPRRVRMQDGRVVEDSGPLSSRQGTR